MSVVIYPYHTLGHAHHGWLEARHHFSFGHYYNPQRQNFGTLHVINDDCIQSGRGFAPHSHQNMEIITYVRRGAITHTDSMQNTGRTAAGDVQVMSAGRGITHSEYNYEDIPTTLYQIWIEPHTQNVQPRWYSAEFLKVPCQHTLNVLVSGQIQHAHTNALPIYADAAIYGGVLLTGTQITQAFMHQAYVLVAQGEITLNNSIMRAGDGAEITHTQAAHISATTDAEVVLIDVPPHADVRR